MKKAILFLGVSDFNCQIVEIAKKLGYATICVNKNKNNISLKMANFSKVLDSGDIVPILDFIFSIRDSVEIKLVYSSGEFFVTKEAISSFLGLECNSLKTAFAAQNKGLAREMFVASNVPIAKGQVVGTLNEARTAARKLKYPVILKPVNKLGGLGVRVAYGEKEILGAYLESSYYSQNIIVEKFYEGSLHDANGFFYKGKFYQAGISDKIPSLGQYKYIRGLSCPSTLSDSQKKDLYRLLEKCARAIGVSVGPVKGDAILTGEGFKMMEIALRFHGPLSTIYCLPFAEGILPFEYYLNVISGAFLRKNGQKYKRSFSAKNVKKQKSFVYVREIRVRPGVILGISGEKGALKIAGVKTILIQKKVNERIEKVKSNYDIFGYVVILSKDRESAIKIFDEFSKVFKVKVGEK